MTRPILDFRTAFARLRALALLAAVAGLLAGCETASLEAGAKPEASKPSEPPKIEPPMTRSRAASECWMKTEKGLASGDIDKRADIVTKCIDEKLKAAPPKT